MEEPKIMQIAQLTSSQNSRVIDPEGISYAMANGEKDGTPKIIEPMCSVHPLSHKAEFNPKTSIKPYAPALRATDYKCPHCVYEPMIGAMRGRNPDNPSEIGKSNGKYKQRLEMNKNGTSNTLTGVLKDNLVVEPRYRIRKLTPRECFRLMDVDDADIDKIQEAGISNSQQYKMAGNSIVVACLYHLFRKMFTETQNEERQLTFW